MADHPEDQSPVLAGLQDHYHSLARRVLFPYAGMMPEINVTDLPEASAESQRQMFAFLVAVARAIYADPALIGITEAADGPDGAYPDWALRNSRPDLGKKMNAIKKKTDDFYWQLIEAGRAGVIEDGRLTVPKARARLTVRTRKTLAQLGISVCETQEALSLSSAQYPLIFAAWMILARQALAGPPEPAFPAVGQRVASVNSLYPILVFSHGLFQRLPATGYSRNVFSRLFPDPAALQLLDAQLLARGYRYIDIRENEYSMDWVKFYGRKNEPLKSWWAERSHGGFSVTFDPVKLHPFVCGLRVPRFKAFLARFTEMPPDLQSFIIRQTKPCDRCGYCTQTDKTGLRPRQATTVTFQGGSHTLCQLFPGFTYRWTTLDERLVDQVIRFLDHVDQLFRTR